MNRLSEEHGWWEQASEDHYWLTGRDLYNGFPEPSVEERIASARDIDVPEAA